MWQSAPIANGSAVADPFNLARRFGPRWEPIAAGVSVGGGFSGATVLRTVCRGGTLAVRFWPTSADPQRLADLHRLLAAVGAAGVPVAVPLADAAGRTLFPPPPQSSRPGNPEAGGNRWWQAEPWLPGWAALEDESPDERAAATRLDAAMETLAAFHEAAARFALRAAAGRFATVPPGPPPTVLDRLDLLRRLAGETDRLRAAAARDAGAFGTLATAVLAAFDRGVGRITAELRAAAQRPVPRLPCLRDVWPAHMLFVVDHVTGLLDPAACRTDTVAADLARLLGGLPGDAGTTRTAAAVAAYARRRPLTDAEAALVPVLIRSGGLLSGMNWLRRRYLADEPDTPAVRHRLTEIVRRLDTV